MMIVLCTLARAEIVQIDTGNQYVARLYTKQEVLKQLAIAGSHRMTSWLHASGIAMQLACRAVLIIT